MTRDVDRRKFLKLAGSAGGAAMLAGCAGGDGTPTPTSTPSDGDDDDGTATPSDGTETPGDIGRELPSDLAEPGNREEYLQRANLVLNVEAPWIFLNRQYSVYGKSTRVDWTARADETIEGYAIEPTEGSSVTITQSQMDSGLDPHDHRETPTQNIVTQTYEGLLGRDADGRIVNELATGYERSGDAEVTFELRSGVSFHSGDSLTAEDAAYSINRIVQSDVGGLESPQSDQLAGVTGAEAGSDSTVVVSTDGFNPTVFALFASYCDIVNQSWMESNDAAYINSNMNGTGPFQLETYEQDVQVVYSSYGDYWRDAAPADELTIQAAGEASTRVNQLLSDETDIIVNVPSADNAEIAATASTRVIYNAMVYNAEPFDSVEFRQAMNYAVDMESIVENILSGFADVTSQPTLENFTGHNTEIDPYPYDPDQAEALVEASGYSGAEITLHTPVGRYLQDVEIAQAVVGYIDELPNVSAEVQQRDFGNLAGELLDGDITTGPDFYLIGWGNTTFDASQTIIPLLTTDGALTSYSNEQVDELINTAQSRIE
jgi:peptide/nickel transport system substrate-binding protein